MEPTAYGHTTETHGGPPPIGPSVEYAKSISGLLKIAEVFLCILILICASVDNWYSLGGGWVQFVAASAMITTAILFIFHFINLIPRLPGPWAFIEFIYYCVYCILFIIACIVAAVRANLTAAIGATCFFCFVALAIYIVDTYFMYKAWQEFQHTGHSMSGISGSNDGGNMSGATTTTTTTTYETRTQY